MKPLFRSTAMLLGLTAIVSAGFSQSFSGARYFIESAQASLSLGTSAVTAPVGTTAGSFQVDGNGGANYTIPIEVPPGRSGIKPQLSLQYNSQQTNGLLGMGWSLTGLSAIARCPKTIAQDDAVGGINFDSNDRFCLDGQRLVAVNGDYGADGTVYSTERESWMKIVSHGSASSGPEYFTAVAKNGSPIEFGNTVDSRIEATGKSEVRVWTVNRVTDRNGNYLTVAYKEDQANGEYYPINIQYTGNTNGYAPQKQVKFVYEERTDTSTAYIAGSMVTSTKRLKAVRTYLGITLVKEYNLVYEYGETTGRSRMTSVQECGGDSVCLPATTFGWNLNPDLGLVDYPPNSMGSSKILVNWCSSSQTSWSDFNGDGFQDLHCDKTSVNGGSATGDHYVKISDGKGNFTYPPNTVGSKGLILADWCGKDQVSWSDFNGDGLEDLHCDKTSVNGGSATGDHYVLISDGTGNFTYPLNSLSSSKILAGWCGKDRVSWSDFNGDGFEDLHCDKTSVGGQGTDNGNHYVLLSDGTGELTPLPHSNSAGLIKSGWCGKDQVSWSDFNGDGLQDLHCDKVNGGSATGDHYVLISDGKGNFTYPSNLSSSEILSDWCSSSQTSWSDFNGDGLQDLHCDKTSVNGGSATGNHYVKISDGAGNFTYPPNTIGGKGLILAGWCGKDQVSWSDFNGDGLEDLHCDKTSVYGGSATGDHYVLISDGKGNLTYPLNNLSSSKILAGWCGKDQVSWSDFNGDGLQDLHCDKVNGGSATGDHYVLINQAVVPDHIISITNGFGSQTLVEYKPLTDDSVYTKGSGAQFPVFDIQAPMLVVSRHTLRENADTSAQSFIYDHQYKTARTNLHRGWQGFKKTILIDQQNGTQTTTTHYMDFPFTGMIQKRTITDQTDNTTILGITSWDYQSEEANGVYRVWLDNSNADHYTDGTYNYTLGSVYTYDDDHRNITQVWHQGDKGEDLGTEEQDDFYTCTQYYSGQEDDWWHTSFPKATKRVRTASACNNWGYWDTANDLTWHQYDYDVQMNPTVTEAWDDSRNEFIATATGYDAYGNITSVSDALGNESTISYDTTYYTFPVTRTTPRTADASRGLTVTTEFEPKFGIKTKITDANGVISMQIPDDGIDGMGRVVKVNGPDPDGNLITLGTTSFLSGINNSGMIITTRNRTAWAGGNTPDSTWLQSEKHIDGLGRAIKTMSNGYADGISLVSGEVEFNSKGQVEKSYLPYYLRASDSCFQAVLNGPCVSKQFSTHEYDIHGRPSSTTAPNGAVEKYTYNLQDDRQVITQKQDPTQLGGSTLVDWTEYYTSRGRVKERIAPDRSTEKYEYDVLGRVIRVTDPLGQISTTVYSSLGKVTSQTQVERGTITYSYNKNGNLVERIDAKNQKIAFTYDALGRILIKQVYNNQADTTPAKTVTYSYDEAGKDNSKGHLTTVDSPDSTREFSYDATGAVKEKKVVLDIDGDGTKGTDGNAEETLMSRATFDAAGRIDEISYPDGSLARHNYRTEDGTLESIEMQEPGQPWKTYASYDALSALGALTQVRYGSDPSLGTLSTYTYDTVGRLTASATAPAYGNTASGNTNAILDFNYSWNLANKLLQITDNANNGLGQTFNDGTNSSYDNRGRLLKAQGFYGTKDYAYDATGNLTQQGSAWYVNSSSKKNQLEAVCSADPGSSPCPEEEELEAVSYDANGNMWQRVAGSLTTVYTYDAENRLIKIQKNGITLNSFTYDYSGNRISKTDYNAEGEETLTSFYFGLYEIVRKADDTGIHTKYLMGPQGVIAAISKDHTDILDNWLAFNTGTLLAAMSDPLGSLDGLDQYLSGKVAQLSFYPFAGEALKTSLGFGYMALVFTGIPYLFVRSAARMRRGVLRGLRRSGVIEKLTDEQGSFRIAGSEKRPGRLWMASGILFIFIGGTVLAPTLAFAGLKAGSNGPGVPEAGTVLFFHHDHLGSDILVTDESGNEVSRVAYEPYGQMDQGKSNGADNFRAKFTGKEWESGSNLYYFGARYYDPQLGRFLTQDPAGQFHSPYMYGSGDPLSGVDPDGRFFISLAIIGVSLLLGVYMGGSAVNHSANPASWDWKAGKTWAGIAGGAAIGVVTTGAGLYAASAVAAGVTAGMAAAGLTGAVATAATYGGAALAMGAAMGTMAISFSAMGGAKGADLGKAFGRGFAMGFVFSIPIVGDIALVGMTGNDAYQIVKNPSVGNGISLGMDILFLAMAAENYKKKIGQYKKFATSVRRVLSSGVENHLVVQVLSSGVENHLVVQPFEIHVETGDSPFLVNDPPPLVDLPNVDLDSDFDLEEFMQGTGRYGPGGKYGPDIVKWEGSSNSVPSESDPSLSDEEKSD